MRSHWMTCGSTGFSHNCPNTVTYQLGNISFAPTVFPSLSLLEWPLSLCVFRHLEVLNWCWLLLRHFLPLSLWVLPPFDVLDSTWQLFWHFLRLRECVFPPIEVPDSHWPLLWHFLPLSLCVFPPFRAKFILIVASALSLCFLPLRLCVFTLPEVLDSCWTYLL